MKIGDILGFLAEMQDTENVPYFPLRASRGCFTRVSQTSYGSQADASIGALANEIIVGILRCPDCDSLSDALRAMAFSCHG